MAIRNINSFIAGIYFIRQILTNKDGLHAERVKGNDFYIIIHNKKWRDEVYNNQVIMARPEPSKNVSVRHEADKCVTSNLT